MTLPAVVADTQLLSSQVTIAVIRAATVVLAVWNVAGFSLPVAVTLTVNPTRGRVGWAAPPMAGAIVGARVDPEKDSWRRQKRSFEGGDLEFNTTK